MNLTREGGVSVHYRLDGPPGAPVLVLANSLGTTTDLWGPQVAAFSQYFQVVRYDLRGHGGSSGPPGPYAIAELAGDVVALLDALDVERASVAGISLGGMVGMWLAAHVPERVDRLVLCCTAAQLGTPESWHERAALVRAEGLPVLEPVLLERWLTPASRTAEPGAVELVRSMLAAVEREGYAACCEAIAGMDQRADLAGITAPTLVVAGADDPVVTPAAAVELQAAVPGAALAVIAGAAHLANLEHPRRFTTLLLDHLLGLAVHRGEESRRAVLGDAHVDRSIASASLFDAPFVDFVTRYAWGDIWLRPGIDRRMRSLLTVGLLTALGRLDELELHVRAALRYGVSSQEIGEVLLHCAVYAGAPAANSAFAVAKRVVDAGGEGRPEPA